MLKKVRIFLTTERVGVAARLFEDMLDGMTEADVLADAVRKSFRETLERYAERLSNTEKLRKHFAAK